MGKERAAKGSWGRRPEEVQEGVVGSTHLLAASSLHRFPWRGKMTAASFVIVVIAVVSDCLSAAYAHTVSVILEGNHPTRRIRAR